MENVGSTMRFISLLLLGLTLIFTLASCDESAKDLEITRLKAKIESQFGKRQADLALEQSYADAYEGCIFLFNICPADTTAQLKESKTRGFAGGMSYFYWMMVIFKFLAVATAVGGFWAASYSIAHYSYLFFVKPIEDEVNTAKEVLLLAQSYEGKKAERTNHLNQLNKSIKLADKEIIDRKLDIWQIESDENTRSIESAALLNQMKAEIAAAGKELQVVQRLKVDFGKL